jgi:diguanylate cyclase (GGDEF)-like protein
VIDSLMHVSSIDWEGRVAVLAIFEDVTAKKLAEAELRRLASVDLLTSLATREHFMAHIEQALSRMKRGADREVAMLMIELDHFTTTSDALGQLAGEAVLRLFSALLRDELRKVDFAGRLGGEKFAVLLPETDRPAATVFAERLRNKVAGTSIIIDDRQVAVTVSIGLAAMNVEDESPEPGLLQAERALAAARQAGGDRVAISERADQQESVTLLTGGR